MKKYLILIFCLFVLVNMRVTIHAEDIFEEEIVEETTQEEVISEDDEEIIDEEEIVEEEVIEEETSEELEETVEEDEDIEESIEETLENDEEETFEDVDEIEETIEEEAYEDLDEPEEIIEEVETIEEDITEEIEVIEDNNEEEITEESKEIEEITEEVVEEEIKEEELIKVEEASNEIKEVKEVKEITNKEVIILEEVIVEEKVVKSEAKDAKVSKYAKVSIKEPSINGFAVRLYKNVLNRAGEDNGLDYWTSSLRSGKETGSSALKGFFLSNEFINKKVSDKKFVELLYKTALNRKADQGGLDYWLNRLKINMSRESIIKGLVESNEFANLCKEYKVNKGTLAATKYYRDRNYDVTSFVDRMYTKALERNAEVSGVEYWCKRLIEKTSTGSNLVSGFLMSKEFEDKKLSNNEFINKVYVVAFNRTADTSGMKHWSSKLDDIYTREYVLASIAESNEFTKLCNSYNITRGKFTVTNKYKTVQNNPIPYYNQVDSKWAYRMYGPYTFWSTGCTPTSLSMVFSSLSGKEILPTDVADYLYNETGEFNRGIYKGCSGKSVTVAAEHYGFKALPLLNVEDLKLALKAGHNIIGIVDYGYFSLPGGTHTVAFSGYSDGQFYAHDPANTAKCKWYDIEAVFAQRSTLEAASYKDAYFYAIYK